MNTSRILPIANLIGCVLITGIIVFQWMKERVVHLHVEELNRQLVTAGDELSSEKARVLALENDVSQLKESVESTMMERKEAEETIVRMTAEQNARVAEQTAAAQKVIGEQTQIWEKAIADRDARLRELGTALSATRARLDAAVQKLKEAGAR